MCMQYGNNDVTGCHILEHNASLYIYTKSCTCMQYSTVKPRLDDHPVMSINSQSRVGRALRWLNNVIFTTP